MHLVDAEGSVAHLLMRRTVVAGVTDSVHTRMAAVVQLHQACAWTSTRAQIATLRSVGLLGSGGRAGWSTMNQLPI